MGKVKLFWKAECPQCGNAKIVGSQLKQEGLAVYDYNLDTTDGLAEASYYGVMSTPTIIVEDKEENTIASFSGQVPTSAEVKKAIARYYH
jgi:thioredoxin-related protein